MENEFFETQQPNKTALIDWVSKRIVGRLAVMTRYSEPLIPLFQFDSRTVDLVDTLNMEGWELCHDISIIMYSAQLNVYLSDLFAPSGVPTVLHQPNTLNY